MQAALAGLDAYQSAPRLPRSAPMPAIAQARGAALRDYGGTGAALVVVPSLINPPSILDLDAEASLLRWLSGQGRRTLLIDWGPVADRADLDIAGHVREILVPLLGEAGPEPALLGYCLGGTMAMLTAKQTPVRALATIAAPWHFDAYPDRDRIAALWHAAAPAAEALGLLPIEALQSGFWSLDPARTVQKFIDFAALDPTSPAAARFVALEDWANQGDPLPLPAARELFAWFESPPPPRGRGPGGGAVRGGPRGPHESTTFMGNELHFASTTDKIVPLASTPRTGTRIALPYGHVGMVVGSHARETLWQPLADWLGEKDSPPACGRG